MLVVDASIALAWALPDETSAYADAVLAYIEADGILVPELWPYEVANGLAIAHLRQRITVDQQQEIVAGLARLNIRSERRGVFEIIGDGMADARRYSLTAYDSAYVSLAARQKLGIATLDNRMRDAARKAGVAIFEASPEVPKS